MKNFFKIVSLLISPMILVICISPKPSSALKNSHLNNIFIIKQSNFQAPIKGLITSSFAYRFHPITNKLDFHPALDIAAPLETKIFAIAQGQVKQIGVSKIFGNFIIISHPNNAQSKYCHCNQILVPVKKHIKRGELIATVGHSGLVTGNHLHLEISINNTQLDPLLFINFNSLE